VVAWLALVSGCFAVLGGAATVLVRPSLQSAAMLAGGVAAIVTAWGLRKRLEWARQGIMAVCVYAAASGFVSAAMVRQNMERQLSSRLGQGTAGQIPKEQLDEIADRVKPIAMASAVVFAIIDGLILLKMRSPGVREEFDAAD
jgi:energy-converting hydrogenase Eha subunit C